MAVMAYRHTVRIFDLFGEFCAADSAKEIRINMLLRTDAQTLVWHLSEACESDWESDAYKSM